MDKHTTEPTQKDYAAADLTDGFIDHDALVIAQYRAEIEKAYTDRIAALEAALAAEKEKARRLREFAEEVDKWAKAYPEAIFPEPTPEQIDKVCDRLGFRLDRISAMILRHFTDPWGKKAREVLKETEES